MFVADLRGILSGNGSLESYYRANNGPELALHDAKADCDALRYIMKAQNVTVAGILSKTIALESVYAKRQHPLLRAKVVTPLVEQLVMNITCKDYLAMSDEDVIKFLSSCGVKKVSIAPCLKKRRQYNGK